MFLEFRFRPQTCSSLAKRTFAAIREFTYWYWPNPLPVLAESPTDMAKSPTSIGQIAYQYWPNPLPVLAKSPTGIGQIVYRY